MAKIIIGIHGLGNKPPQEILYSWWEKSIQEGLSSAGIKRKLCPFELVYWAGHIYPEPLQPAEKNPESQKYITDPYIPRMSVKERNSLGFAKEPAETRVEQRQ